MQISAVLFDLDGTLLDTLADLAHSANYVLESYSFASHPVDAYRFFVGEGVSVLFRRALPPPQRTAEWIDRCAEQFRAIYEQNWNVHTQPYAGISELLSVLAARRFRLAILSNKPHVFTERCTRELLSEHAFEVVLGQRDETPCKPDPAGALEIARRMKLRPRQYLYVGDSGIDMQTAVRAGMYPVGALWGFRPREELIQHGAKAVIERPMDLVNVLARLTPSDAGDVGRGDV